MGLSHLEWNRAQDLLLKLVQVLTPLTEQSLPTAYILNQRFFAPPRPSEELNIRHPVTLLSSLHKEVEKMIGEIPVGEKKEGSVEAKSEPKEGSPLAKQAKRLIDQVQEAIGKLCHSSNIKDPKEEPLREALKRLKPNLEKIIEAVNHEGMHSSDDGLPSPFRYPVPRSAREELIKKLISFPEREPMPRKEEGEIKREKSLPREARASSFRVLTSALERGEEGSRIKGSEVPEEWVEPKLPVQAQEKGAPRPVDRASIPAAPFTPETRTLTPGRKKKKRKGFWFRDDQNPDKE